MSEELTMPRLSDTMEEGRIGRWLKREGDSFREGDVIAEIETDKATMEFRPTTPAPSFGSSSTTARRPPWAPRSRSSATPARRSRAPAEEAAEPEEAPA